MSDDPLLRSAYEQLLGEKRLLIAVLYVGPWDRLASWLWGIGRDGEVRHEVRLGSLRERLATRVEAKDFRWRDKYAVHDELPNDRWKRKLK